MDVFENKIDNEKFKSTNQIWNELCLNTSWSVGFVSQIIKSRKFQKKEDWYDFYFKSGQERLKLISKLPKNEQSQLLSDTKINYYGNNAHLNLYYGRTKEEIAHKGNILYKEILKQGNPLNLQAWECQFIAFYRTVCETWNGVMIREINTKNKIEKHFFDKNIYVSLIDTSGKFDYNYAVDFEVYYEGKIICGLQIKPPSYKNKKNDYIENAHATNVAKNEKYTEKYNRPVFYVYSNQNGYISNEEILIEIKKLLL